MKDAYYFPHDYNAKDDPKCERLLYEMGQEGYGIFWTLIEVLRAQPDYTYPMANLPIVARKYNADEDKLRRVIDGYGLFVVTDDQHFCWESRTAGRLPAGGMIRFAREGSNRFAGLVTEKVVEMLADTRDFGPWIVQVAIRSMAVATRGMPCPVRC